MSRKPVLCNISVKIYVRFFPFKFFVSVLSIDFYGCISNAKC